MLCLGKSFTNKAVLSLRTGAPIAECEAPIINPNNLKIEGWLVVDRFNKKQLIVLSQEVRDIIDKGLVVNDHDALSEPDDLVRLKDVLELSFELLEKPVITENKQKLGKVNDYAFDKDSFFVQKLYVGQSLIKSISGGALLIDRTQIIEITNKKIVVKEATAPDKVTVTAPAAI